MIFPGLPAFSKIVFQQNIVTDGVGKLGEVLRQTGPAPENNFQPYKRLIRQSQYFIRGQLPGHELVAQRWQEASLGSFGNWQSIGFLSLWSQPPQQSPASRPHGLQFRLPNQFSWVPVEIFLRHCKVTDC